MAVLLRDSAESLTLNGLADRATIHFTQGGATFSSDTRHGAVLATSAALLFMPIALEQPSPLATLFVSAASCSFQCQATPSRGGAHERTSGCGGRPPPPPQRPHQGCGDV